MEKLNQLLEALEFENQISLRDIPEIDLYMDQVIQLFENKFRGSKRNEEEKILTKTMINNYAKSKLFFPIKNKKYSKEHILLISLIYQLKGALSIGDIKETFRGLNQLIMEEDSFQLEAFYHSYLEISQSNSKNFRGEIEGRLQEVEKEIEKLESTEADYLQKVMLITSLVNMSNLYRRVAEKLVDEITEENERKKEPK